jgi:hypothetical protein
MERPKVEPKAPPKPPRKWCPTRTSRRRASGPRPAATRTSGRKRFPGVSATRKRLPGDSYITIGKEFAYFERHQPFSLSLWVRLDKPARLVR